MGCSRVIGGHMIGVFVLIVILVSIAAGILTTILLSILRKLLGKGERIRQFGVGFFTLLTALASSFFIKSVTIVGNDEIGIVDVRYSPFRDRLPAGRYVADADQIGIQAAILEPGLHFTPTIFTNVTIEELTEINQGMVGIVEALDGKPLPANQEISTFRWEDDGWYEPVKFLKSRHAYQGIQSPPLRPGKHRLHPDLFRVIEVDTTLQIVRFGTGEGDDIKGKPGRMGEIYISAQGTSLIANFRVNYRVTPDSAYKAISKLGINFKEKMLDLVQSSTRTTVRSVAEPLNLFELRDNRESHENEILEKMKAQLAPYGVEVDLAAFTSIFAPDGEEGKTYTSLEKSRSQRELEKESYDVALLKLQNRKVLAEKELEASKAEAAVKLENILLEKKLATEQLEVSKLTAEARSEETRYLSKYLGPQGAVLFLSVKEASNNNIDLLPDFVVPNGGDALPAFLLESYLGTKVNDRDQ